MLPIEDRPEEPRLTLPLVMLALLILNVLVYCYELSLSPVALRAFIGAYGVTPAAIVNGNEGTTLRQVPLHATILTAMFIHGNILHLATNMIFLWVFGDNVESAFGHLTFLGLYLASGIVAFVTQILVSPLVQLPTIGASGAVAGVLAAYLLLFPRAPVRVLLLMGPFFTIGRIAALPLIGLWFLLQLVFGFQSLGEIFGGAEIAYFAHVGGFLFGIAFTGIALFLRHERIGRLRSALWWDRSLRNSLLVVAALLATLALASLIDGTTGRWLRLAVALGAAILALTDGVLRVSGRTGLLGEGRGFGKLLAIVQVLVALGVLFGLLLA